MSIILINPYVLEIINIKGQAEYTTSGTYNFVVPAGVTSISAVVVGAGGGSSYDYASGAGGGLRYINGLSVTPGETLTVTVGAGGRYLNTLQFINGGPTYIARSGSNLIMANGGGTVQYLVTSLPAGGTGTAIGGSIGGGNGGTSGRNVSPSISGGGGGAGGYSGNGGRGGTSTSGMLATAGVGGAGGGGGSGNFQGGRSQGGGGVGLLGQGANGTAGVYNQLIENGGSGGTRGNNEFGSPANAGGPYGGGSGSYQLQRQEGNWNIGGVGAARIIWGNDRSFPSTNTGNQ